MTSPLVNKAWLALCLLPSIAAIIVTILSNLALPYQLGGDAAVAYAISFTLAEGMMMVSALGILASVKSQAKPSLRKTFRLVNVLILIASGFTGYFTFMNMVS